MRVPRAITLILHAVRRRPRLALGVGVGLLAACGSGTWWGVRKAYLRVGVPEIQDAAVLLANVPAPRPNSVVTFDQGCTTSRCHAGMVGAPAVHEPIAMGKCDECHGPDAGGHAYPLVRNKSELCTTCHDTGLHERYQHQAMGDEGCVACHDAHAGATPALLVSPTQRETCGRCHPRSEGSVRHKPYQSDRCDACHEPHGADNQHLLVGGADEAHCARCHGGVVLATEGGPHDRLEGRCLSCHAPHASNDKGLLRAGTSAICTSCHPKIGQAIATAVVSHDPVLKGEQCTTCHDPHSSSRAKMLRNTKAQVCLSCHDKAVEARDGRRVAEMASSLANAPVVHGAVQLGDCSTCHSVHGSSHERLLREGAANILLGPYDARNYALCFSCHDKSMAEPWGATAFRDGETNLHSVHLKSGDRSRSCATCHTVHAGDQPRLMAKSVNLDGSTWSMPMGFTLTDDGGRCASACHEPLSYSRHSGGAKGMKNGGIP